MARDARFQLPSLRARPNTVPRRERELMWAV